MTLEELETEVEELKQALIDFIELVADHAERPHALADKLRRLLRQ